MKITLNNREERIDQNNISVQELIDLKKYSFKMLVTKVNGQLVKKEDREKVFIKEGDNVAIIHLISGG
jgi:thiamine biosynthesis protein ThiS